MTLETLKFWLDTEGGALNENNQLRPYQLESRNRILYSWLNGARSVMYQSPTGSGKTVTIASIVKLCADIGFKTLTLAHREELVDNIRNEYADMFGLETGAIKSGLKRDYTLHHQVASIATYVNALDFQPDLIITDEGHHCLAATYRTIYAAHANAKLLMVTATPYRLSGVGFRDICDELVLSMSVLQLEQRGNILPARLFTMRTFTKEQMAQVHVVKGEYSESDMSDLMSERDQIMSVVDTYIERGDGKQMMLYATDVNHSKKLLEAFTFRGIAAGHVDGKTKNRKEVFTQFVNKEIQVLSNCEIATEGNNIPGIEIIGLARKTKSLSLYLQMVGRGSRPAEGKTEYLLFDFVDNYWDHGLPNREHDWRSHFMGLEKADRKRRLEEAEEKQFAMRTEDGEFFISTLADLPNGFRGEILQEVDPLNTRHAEMLRRQAEKQEAIERKKAEKQAEIERRIAAREAEIIRRREEKEAEIQRKKDAKLAEIQRKKDIIQQRIAAKEAARQAEIARKQAVKQAEIDRKEAIRIAKEQKRDAYYDRINRSSNIGTIQYQQRVQRSTENDERSLTQRDNHVKRWEVIREKMKEQRPTDYASEEYKVYNDSLNSLFEETRLIEKWEAAENKRVLQYQRIEIQFEKAVVRTHNLGSALLTVCAFCAEKNYPKPTPELMASIAAPYLGKGGAFARAQFDEALATLESFDEVSYRQTMPVTQPRSYSRPRKGRKKARSRRRR